MSLIVVETQGVALTLRHCAEYNATAKATCAGIKEDLDKKTVKIELLSCSVCYSDLCNSAMLREGTIIGIFVGIFVTHFMLKLLV